MFSKKMKEDLRLGRLLLRWIDSGDVAARRQYLEAVASWSPIRRDRLETLAQKITAMSWSEDEHQYRPPRGQK